MARTALTLQTSTRDGITPTYGAANVDGMAFNNATHNVMIHVKNGGASPITVTVQIPGTIEGSAKPDKTITVANASEKLIGPFPSLYDQDSTTPDISVAVLIDFSAVTSVTIAALKLGSLAT